MAEALARSSRALLALTLIAGCGPDGVTGARALGPDGAGLDAAPDLRPNVVLFMTDDQRADALWPMRSVLERLADPGLRLDRAYVNTPLCCPARASIAAGGFLAQDTGVLTNHLPNGGNSRFDDERSLALNLQRSGYRTGLVGKYLHETAAAYVPPGWDVWVRPDIDEDWNRYDVARGSSDDASGTADIEFSDQYLAEFLSDESVAFVEDAGEEPFFLWVNHWAPHFPSTPADVDEGTFEGLVHRGGAWNEADVGDKPPHFDDIDLLDADEIAQVDQDFQAAMESLLAVDRAVADLLDALEAADRMDDTVFIFTSDNGTQWGEHRLRYKGVPYEESVRVPLLIRAPDGPTGIDDRLVSVTTDLGATIYDLAGVDAPTDGRSLRPLLEGGDAGWRVNLQIEGYEGITVPTFAGVIGARYKYLTYVSGGEELYDLELDPAERTSLHLDPGLADVRRFMSDWLEERRGLSFAPVELTVIRDEPMSFSLSAWGGTPPFTWETTGALPDGLSLSSDGVISGTPTTVSSRRVAVRVTGSGLRRHDGAAEDYTSSVQIAVDPPGASAAKLSPPPAVVAGRTSVEVVVPTPEGALVTVTLSGDGDFEDAAQRQGVGPDPVLRFDGLRPGWRYKVRVEGMDAPQQLEVWTRE